uniref:Uncharacterized protein n=1 Tax=Rhizophora mucronata TaxID=61149 RepID=A0A2P2PSN2_RHIMU
MNAVMRVEKLKKTKNRDKNLPLHCICWMTNSSISNPNPTSEFCVATVKLTSYKSLLHPSWQPQQLRHPKTCKEHSIQKVQQEHKESTVEQDQDTKYCIYHIHRWNYINSSGSKYVCERGMNVYCDQSKYVFSYQER